MLAVFTVTLDLAVKSPAFASFDVFATVSVTVSGAILKYTSFVLPANESFPVIVTFT